jgi:hypothetical protein
LGQYFAASRFADDDHRRRVERVGRVEGATLLDWNAQRSEVFVGDDRGPNDRDWLAGAHGCSSTNRPLPMPIVVGKLGHVRDAGHAGQGPQSFSKL